MVNAKAQINKSLPYFTLLSDKTVKKQLRVLLIKQAPEEFYDVLTQIVRHLINGTFSTDNTKYCEKFENSLYILASPSISRKIKENIILLEPFKFIEELFSTFKKAYDE